MPFMHSEDLAHQRRSVELFRGLGEDDADDPYAVRHMEIVERFAREVMPRFRPKAEPAKARTSS